MFKMWKVKSKDMFKIQLVAKLKDGDTEYINHLLEFVIGLPDHENKNILSCS